MEKSSPKVKPARGTSKDNNKELNNNNTKETTTQRRNVSQQQKNLLLLPPEARAYYLSAQLKSQKAKAKAKENKEKSEINNKAEEQKHKLRNIKSEPISSSLPAQPSTKIKSTFSGDLPNNNEKQTDKLFVLFLFYLFLFLSFFDFNWKLFKEII